jgi:hypothetical protein
LDDAGLVRMEVATIVVEGKREAERNWFGVWWLFFFCFFPILIRDTS